MNIDWLIPCRFVEVHDNLATIVGAGIDTITVPAVPSPVGVHLAVRLVGEASEFDASVDHKLTNIITSPDGSVLNRIEGTFNVGAEHQRPEFLATMVMPMAVGFLAQIEGTYMIELDVNGITKAAPLHIVVAS